MNPFCTIIECCLSEADQESIDIHVGEFPGLVRIPATLADQVRALGRDALGELAQKI